MERPARLQGGRPQRNLGIATDGFKDGPFRDLSPPVVTRKPGAAPASRDGPSNLTR